MPAQTYARPLRAVAVLIAVSSTLWELTNQVGGDLARSLMTVRIVETVIALAIAALSRPTWPVRTLQVLSFALALDVVVANLAVLAITPTFLWEVTGILTAVVLGAALFAPWPWHWQASLAAVVTASTLAAVAVWVPPDANPSLTLPRLAILLATVSAASVLGSHLANRERERVVASEARYRGLFHGAGDGIAVVDAAGTVLEANPRLEDLLGRPLDEIVGRRLATLVPLDRAADADAEHRAALGGALRFATSTLERPDGGRLVVEITFAAAAGPGRPIVLAVLRDVTDRLEREQHRVQEQRLDSLARFAGGIAHQFNNLLGGILTHASVLRQHPANAPAAAELDEIAEAARRGRALTNELVRFTRHEPAALQPTAVDAVITSVAELARATLPADARVTVQVAPGLPAMLADSDHLLHACRELVLNARDALKGRPDPILTVAAAEERVVQGDRRWPRAAPGHYVRIAITDNGRGMDPTTLGRVFEPFFTTKPMHQAAGLGLAAVHGVLRDHRGAVRVESELRRGTTVHLLIPVSAEPVAPAVATPAPLPAVSAAPPLQPPATILVVDDEEIMRSSIKRALTRVGYTVLEAQDGPSALAALETAPAPVDLVILDLVLPGGGAGIFEVLKAVRPDLKVLVSSGYSPEDGTAKALAGRADGFLAKPYELAELRAAVARVLEGGDKP